MCTTLGFLTSLFINGLKCKLSHTARITVNDGGLQTLRNALNRQSACLKLKHLRQLRCHVIMIPLYYINFNMKQVI